MKHLRLWSAASFALLTGCGQAAVSYGPAIPPDQPNAIVNSPKIAKAAADGGIDVTLPISRLVFQPPGTIVSATRSSTSRSSGSRGGGDSGSGSGTDAAPSSVAGGGVTTTIVVDGNKYAFNVVPVEGDTQFTVKPVNDFFSQNQFSVTRFPNTTIPITVSNTFTDQTVARINAIASIATKLAPIAFAFGVRPSEACTDRLVTVDIEAGGSGTWEARAARCYRAGADRIGAITPC
jgi:hypothetical protein